jgi:hypothetical protein
MNGTSTSPRAGNLIQAVRGPIMLITLGALVEIDYLGIYGFSRTWPVLIIVFGQLKLLEKVAGGVQYDNYPQPPPGGTAI